MQNFVTSISDTFLKELIAEIDDDTIRGIVLGGSHARGDATPYSDVDLACFVPDTYRPLRKRYLYQENHLISIGLKIPLLLTLVENWLCIYIAKRPLMPTLNVQRRKVVEHVLNLIEHAS